MEGLACAESLRAPNAEEHRRGRMAGSNSVCVALVLALEDRLAHCALCGSHDEGLEVDRAECGRG